jgi:hypothetical protein
MKKQQLKRRPLTPPKTPPSGQDHPLEEDPAVERGERIDTGKTIARGGKERGHVPGASQPSPRPPN